MTKVIKTPKTQTPKAHGPKGYSPYFTTKNGKRVYAKDYGHAVWPIGKK